MRGARVRRGRQAEPVVQPSGPTSSVPLGESTEVDSKEEEEERELTELENDNEELELDPDKKEVDSDGEELEDEDEEYQYARGLEIRQNLKKIFNQPTWSDVTFIVGPADKKDEKKTFYGHRTILASRSPVFQAMFYPPAGGAWMETRSREIEVIDLSPNAFQVLLECIYFDVSRLTPTNVVEVLFAAKKYQIERLRKICMRYMARGVGVDEACSMLDTLTGLLPEEAASLLFIEDNAAEVLESSAFLRLSKRNVKMLLGSEKLAAEEEEVFQALVRWGRAECDREGLPSNEKTLKSLLADLVPLIRFPVMNMEQFSLLVPSSGLVDPGHLLALYKYMGDKTKEEEPPSLMIDYICAVCTFVNKGSDAQCVMCQSPAPDHKARLRQIEWNCPMCTFLNAATNSVCDICRTPAPPPPKKEEKVLSAKDYGFPFSLEPRQPRRPDVSRMKFLLLAAALPDELNDVKDHILRAYDEQWRSKEGKIKVLDTTVQAGKKKLVVDTISIAHRTAAVINLKLLTEYDAVLTWSGSQPYRRDINVGDLFADYVQQGGGLVVCCIATNNNPNHYSLRGRYITAGYSPTNPGPQSVASGVAATLVIPPPSSSTDPDSKRIPAVSSSSTSSSVHPLLRHVKRFNGGTSSFHSLVTLAAGAKLVASWSDGAPFVAEKFAFKKKGARSPIVVTLNFFPPSSRMPATSRLGGQGQFWDHTSDGHHLLFNALSYTGLNATLKSKQPAKLK